MSGLIFAVTLKGGAAGTIFHSIGQMTISRKQDRGYVQAVEKNLVATLIAAMTIGQVAPAFADSADTLPDMGTSAGSTLSIGQEMQMGDYYVRQLRGSAPLINDPLLTQYINSLGMRLVSHANSVKTPFHFFLINNDEINAFAFFGGNVVLHSALFRYSDNESQLASVMAHEISHVTQRHLARAMEDQQRSAPLTWVGALGSILLAMASPQAGMAALTGTLAGTRQGMISFTQQNEQEADRIGIQVLQRSGFDPQAMPTFLEKLLDQARYSSRPPEILLTHPLPESRLADARNRANQMRPTVVQSSEDFYLAKARTLGMYNSGVTSSPVICWMSGPKVMCVSNGRRNMVALYRRWKPINSMKRGKHCNHCWRQNRVMRGISIWQRILTSGSTKPAMRSIG